MKTFAGWINYGKDLNVVQAANVMEALLGASYAAVKGNRNLHPQHGYIYTDPPSYWLRLKEIW